MKRSGSKLAVFLTVLVVLGAAGGIYTYYRSKSKPAVAQAAQVVEAKRGNLTV